MRLAIVDELRGKLQGTHKKIVLPEGEDIRVLEAAFKLKTEGIVTPILLGNKEKVKKIAKDNNINIDDIEILNPSTHDKFESYVDHFVEIRKGKNSKEEALEIIKDVNYFGTMMVELGDADGMVSGAIHTTGDTVRPALQIIKTKPGVSRTSGAMILLGDRAHKYLFADIAINPTLDAQQLAEVAVVSGKTAEVFGINPKIALLSFSTNGSAKTPESLKVAEATKIAKEIAKKEELNYKIDGEMQFDTAIKPEVAELKFPDSEVAGRANTFIFPDLQSGNIGYKIAQRLGNLVAVGPILQGLNKPVNDLSRGCVAEDIYITALVTAAQSL